MNNLIRASANAAPEFVVRLRAARLAKGLTQRALGDRTGWGLERLHGYESGNRSIHPRLLAQWADALGLCITAQPRDMHCRVCHCTEHEPCEGGCGWVTDGTLEIDLCTLCAWTIARDAITSGLIQPADLENQQPTSDSPNDNEAYSDTNQPAVTGENAET